MKPDPGMEAGESAKGATANGAVAPALFANSYRNVHPRVEAIGFRTHALKSRSQAAVGVPHIAEEFLIATRFSRHDRETEESVKRYFRDDGTVMLSLLGKNAAQGLGLVDMPNMVRLRRELGEAIARRRSTRRYTGDALEFADVATIVRTACGVTATATVGLDGGGEVSLRFRATPSGGGLYPIDLYIAGIRVRGLGRGVYRYDPVRDRLVHEGRGDELDRLLGSFVVAEELLTLSRAGAALFLVGRPWRSMRKYGPRGMRLLFLEAGAMSQNVHLTAEALGCGSVDCASVYDDEVHDALGVDGLHQSLLHAIVLGVPAE